MDADNFGNPELQAPGEKFILLKRTLRTPLMASRAAVISE
jgi:hypothetical protein